MRVAEMQGRGRQNCRCRVLEWYVFVHYVKWAMVLMQIGRCAAHTYEARKKKKMNIYIHAPSTYITENEKSI